MGTLTKTPPRPDEIEVTLFGPGYGESIVIHAEGEWLIVDSCRNPDTKKPVAIEYLDSIGANLDGVSRVICTHWHDDHAKGLADTYRACKRAVLVVSSALRKDEFVKLMEAYKRWPDEGKKVSSGVEEMDRALQEAEDRGAYPRFASQDTRLWQSASGNSELFSLTPSPAMTVKAFKDISLLVPRKGLGKKQAHVRSPNHIAVAMHLRVGPVAILLGSDLEEEGSPDTGWSCIVTSTTRPMTTASLYKVAHHGSVTGEHLGIWGTLLSPKPTSILTPFSKQKLPLPRTSDQARIKRNSSIVILTAKPHKSGARRSGSVGKLTRQKNLRPAITGFGAVRCRADVTVPTAWRLERQDPAHQL